MAKKGEKISEETKIKMSLSQSGSKNHNFGKKTPDSVKEKMSKSHVGLNTWIKGRKLSDEHKLKIKNGNLGKIVTEETRVKMKKAGVERNSAKWLTGKRKKPLSDEVKKKISESRKGKCTGDSNYKWKKDRTLLKDDHRDRGGQLHKEWSKSVKNRDGWKCKISNSDCCGKIEAHHILSWKDYVELRYEVNNGITLCHFHHPRKRNDEMRLSPYFQELINSKLL